MGVVLFVDFEKNIVAACSKAGHELEMMESEIREACERLKAEFERMAQRVAEAFGEIKEEMEKCIDLDEMAQEAQERRFARLLAAQKEAARAKAYGLRMTLEKARRALKRRKRLHDDGGVPDSERQAIR